MVLYSGSRLSLIQVFFGYDLYRTCNEIRPAYVQPSAIAYCYNMLLRTVVL